MLRYVLFITLVASCACKQPVFINTHPTKIFGGSTAKIQDYPFTVSMQLKENGFESEHECGGSIISRKWVVTAAHCMGKHLPSELMIRAGSSRTDSGGQLYEVEQWNMHPQYSKKTHSNDIALIKVATPFTYSRTVKPVKLPKYLEAVRPGARGTITGWGSTNSYNTGSDILMKVKVPIMSNARCQKFYSNHKITKGMICAGFVKGGKDSCQGDSGGPLVVSGKLVGVVSWSIGCALPNYPGVNARVSYYRKWIKSIAGI